MKVVILAGGKGTRIGEESQFRPKPMVEIGGKPILWHIMKLYSYYGFHDFIICCGYKGHMIKEYFVNYYAHNNNISVNLKSGEKSIFEQKVEPWRVTLLDTGLETLTAGRILKVREYINDESFMLTYGDGVSDVNIVSLLKQHEAQGKIVTITTTQPIGRFGMMKIDHNTNQIQGFSEKAREDQSWINMGFMVMRPEVFDYLGDGSAMLEAEPFESLVAAGEMDAYRHKGFWSPMDNIFDRDYLEEIWNTGEAPWKK